MRAAGLAYPLAWGSGRAPTPHRAAARPKGRRCMPDDCLPTCGPPARLSVLQGWTRSSTNWWRGRCYIHRGSKWTRSSCQRIRRSATAAWQMCRAPPEPRPRAPSPLIPRAPPVSLARPAHLHPYALVHGPKVPSGDVGFSTLGRGGRSIEPPITGGREFGNRPQLTGPLISHYEFWRRWRGNFF